MITSSFTDARANDTVEDFCKTFYPVMMGLETEGNEQRTLTEGQSVGPMHTMTTLENHQTPGDGYKSFDTF